MKTSSAAALALAAACLAGPGPGLADESVPAGARRVLDQRFPGWIVESRAIGPLHAADAKDLALVLVRTDAPQTHAVAVLLDDGHGGWRFSKSSSAIDLGTRGEALAADIGARALVVRTTAPGTSVAVVTSYRFAYRDEARVLRLVGLEIERDALADAGRGWRAVTRVDLLTGEKREEMDDHPRGQVRHRDAASRVPLRQPILFEQFAFDTRGLRTEATGRFEPAADGR